MGFGRSIKGMRVARYKSIFKNKIKYLCSKAFNVKIG